MARRKSKNLKSVNRIKTFFVRILLVVNIVLVLMLMVSAYGGHVNPNHNGWLVTATLGFPIMVVLNVVLVIGWLVVCSRIWLISFVALMCCVGPFRTYCPINISKPIPKRAVKVLTYNVFGFSGFPTDSIDYAEMLNFIRNSDADIFCAQEAHYSGNRSANVEDAISHWAYRDTVSIPEGINGLMLCSRFPILDRKIIMSSSAIHGCAVYRLKVDNDTVVVVNSHFVSNKMTENDKQDYKDILLMSEEDSTKDNFMRLCRKVNAAGVERANQVDSLIQYLETLGDVPIVLCGDFNDSPLSYVHTRLTDRLNDAYTVSGNGPGISYRLSGMFFRLDNILCSHHWQAYGAKVMSEYKMSDHYPLEAYLYLVP